MNAYLLQSDKKIEPFGEHPGDCLVTNKKVRDIQQEVLKTLGITLIPITDIARIEDEDEYIVFNDSIFFTRELMQDFIKRSKNQGQPAFCAITPGIIAERTVVATQGVNVHADYIEYNLNYIPPAVSRDKDKVPVVFDLNELESIPMPEHMVGKDRAYKVPMTDKIIIQIDHWANLWAANIGSLLTEAARLVKAPISRQLVLALKAHSVNPWNVMRQTNKIGKHCDIHPTAYIEGSTIGDGCTIGARAIVRQSVIGPNTYLGDNTTAHISVLGEGCNLQSGSLVEFSVLYPGVLSNDRVIAISICGRDCFIAGNVIFTNFRIDKKNIQVTSGDKIIDSGNTFLGSCVGHEVYLGAGCTIAPGRTIPNGTRLAPAEMHVIRKCLPGEEVTGYRRIQVNK